MTEPLPNCFSIWPSAAASAFLRFSSMRAVTSGDMRAIIPYRAATGGL